VKAHVADALLFRHWASWRDDVRSHLFVVDVETKKTRDLTPGPFDAPVFQVGGPAAFDVSPDGTELCFASNRDPDEAKSTNADLWVVPMAGGEAKNLTAANRAWDGTPRYSPDGRFIAFRKQTQPGYESDCFRLALHDRGDGSVRTVSGSFDNWVEDFEWLPDGRRIAFLGPVRGKVPLHVIDVTDGSVRVAAELGSIDAFDLAPDASWAAVARRRVGNPPEVFRVALAGGGEPKRLTFENEAIEKEVDLRPAETIEVPGAGGRPVQVFLVKPHGFDPAKKYPLILNVHGGPQSQWADAFRGDWQVYPGAGYVVAFPNPHGSTGFGQEYTAAISKDWNGKVMEDVEKVTDALAKLPYVDPQRIGAMGWSWGGYAMMWLEGHSTRYKCLASMMGVYDLRAMYSSTEELWFPAWDLGGAPWEAEQLYAGHSPSNFVKSFKTPCLVITGQRDFRVPYTQSLEFFTDLQEMKVPSRLVVFENAGHWPSWTEMALYYNAHLEWFQKWLGGGPAPWSTVEMAEGGGPFNPEEPKPGS
jgi:dipeptidyl aminopeptidase/acylaminoacyl peptidase